jgi:hypothetical protein
VVATVYWASSVMPARSRSAPPLGTWAVRAQPLRGRPRSRPPVGVRPRWPLSERERGPWRLVDTLGYEALPAVLAGARDRGWLPQPGLELGTSSLSETERAFGAYTKAS